MECVTKDLENLQEEGFRKEKELNNLHTMLQEAERVNTEKTISLTKLESQLSGTPP